MSTGFVLAVLALILAIISGLAGRVPLWIAVVLLALAMILPGVNLH